MKSLSILLLAFLAYVALSSQVNPRQRSCCPVDQEVLSLEGCEKGLDEQGHEVFDVSGDENIDGIRDDIELPFVGVIPLEDRAKKPEVQVNVVPHEDGKIVNHDVGRCIFTMPCPTPEPSPCDQPKPRPTHHQHHCHEDHHEREPSHHPEPEPTYCPHPEPSHCSTPKPEPTHCPTPTPTPGPSCNMPEPISIAPISSICNDSPVIHIDENCGCDDVPILDMAHNSSSQPSPTSSSSPSGSSSVSPTHTSHTITSGGNIPENSADQVAFKGVAMLAFLCIVGLLLI